jgi:dTDP-glucose 4,6-dehydratase
MYRETSSKINYVTDRLGHDLKYLNDCYKIQETGWQPIISIYNGLESTIKWYKDNEWFWKKS